MIRGQVDGSSGRPFAPHEPGPADVHYNQQASSRKAGFDLSGPEVCTQQPHMLKKPLPSQVHICKPQSLQASRCNFRCPLPFQAAALLCI